jgi:hypothetical protein
MKFRSYSNEALLQETLNLAEQERLTTLQLIECLEEVESRMLYTELGFSSLWYFCTDYLKMSEGAAQRRIKAMRLSKNTPKVKEAIASGKLSLSNAAKLQTFLIQEKKSGKPVTEQQKLETLEKVFDLSQNECDKTLYGLSPQFEASQKEILRPISPDQNILTIVLDSDAIESLTELKCRLSHQIPNASYKDLIRFLIEEKLKQVRKKAGLDPEPKASPASDPRPKSESQTKVTAAAAVDSQASVTRFRKAIPMPIRKALAQRSGGRCEYLAPDGKRCNSMQFLEIDHILSYALGGSNDLKNLRHYCRAHNLLHAREIFGTEYMKQFEKPL